MGWGSAETALPEARRGRGARLRGSSSSSKKDTSGRKYDRAVGGTKSQRARAAGRAAAAAAEPSSDGGHGGTPRGRRIDRVDRRRARPRALPAGSAAGIGGLRHRVRGG